MSDPIFIFTSTNPFGLSDTGSLAKSTFVDIDGDGDLDAFIGNDYYSPFFRNIGSGNNPDFAPPLSNPFGLATGNMRAAPTFGDIDSDGDLDAFVGDLYGQTTFFKNTGTVFNPVFTNNGNAFGTGVGGSAIPTLVDIDGDGDLDAFVGNGANQYNDYNGDVVFFRNTGTISSPAFSAVGRNPFGLSNVAFSASPTFVDIDSDGDMDAFIGNRTGDTQFFRNIGTSSKPVFDSSELNPFGLSEVGFNAHPTFVDIDADGDLDAFIGNNIGNTLFFANNGILVASTAGNNIMSGTPSLNDTATYTSATAAVTISLLITSQQNTIGAGLDTITNVENLIGSTLSDNLTGDTKDNVLTGNAGNDTLIGWSGADTMIGGIGNDSYFVENIADVVTEKLNEGIDTVSSKLTYALPANVENLILTGTLTANGTGNSLNNVITGNSAANQLNGDAGNDTIIGGGGDDTLTGWSGADSMLGGLGNDTYLVENVGDVVTENLNQGTDTVSSRLTYILPINVDNLTLTGTTAINGTGNNLNNVITGNNAANQLNDGSGNDTLNGGAGNDVLNAGVGTNTLTGGTGNDIFKFTTTGHIDTIIDYNVATDTIQLENAVFTALTTTGTLAAGQFRIGTKALDANDFIIYNNVSGALLYDANGNGAGAAVQIAMIGVGLVMTSADIVVI